MTSRQDGRDPPPEESTPPAQRPPLDLRLVPAALGSWLAAVLALRAPPRLSLGTAAAAATLAVIGLWRARQSLSPRLPLGLCGALVCVAASAAGAGLRVHAIRAGPVSQLARWHAVARAEVVVTADPVHLGARAAGRDLLLVRARLEVVRAHGRRTSTRVPVLVLSDANAAWVAVVPSQRVATLVRLEPARPADDVAAVLRVRGPPRLIGRPSLVQRAAGRIRSGLRAAVAGLPPAEAGLVPGLVDGDVSGLPADLVADFRTTGLTHLTAVSGANCAVVLGSVVLLARWLGARGGWLAVTGAVALTVFLVLARPQPSVLRATVMGMVAVGALLSGRPRQGVPALSAAALLLVLGDPWLARSYGFVLSVLATAALLLLAPSWVEALSRYVPRWIAGAVAVPLAAQLACAPVIVLLSGKVSLVALPANLLAEPAVAPATVLGLLAALCAPVSLPVAHVLAWGSGLAARVVVMSATGFAKVPHGAVPWPPGAVGAVLLAALTTVGVVAVHHGARRGRAGAAIAVSALAIAVAVAAVAISVASAYAGVP